MTEGSHTQSGRLARLAAGALITLGLATGAASPAAAAGDAVPPLQLDWPFAGIFGQFDQAQLQRGYQVYSEVCAGCHALEYLYYRDLAALGYSADQIKGIAGAATVPGGVDEYGDPVDRPGVPADRFARPFANDVAAKASNAGAYPVDLSMVVKARSDGSNYLYSLLTGYLDTVPAEQAETVTVGDGQYYNTYYPGHVLAMAPPLLEDLIEYADGTPATVDQMARDVTAFLTWASEPTMEERKRTGIKVILFLIVMTALFYAVKRKIWADVH